MMLEQSHPLSLFPYNTSCMRPKEKAHRVRAAASVPVPGPQLLELLCLATCQLSELEAQRPELTHDLQYKYVYLNEGSDRSSE